MHTCLRPLELLVLLSFASCVAAGTPTAETSCPDRPLVIAHRGASGDAPEHTHAAYELGILQGADVIEPDLVMSRDGVLFTRHESALGSTTDIAGRPPFAERRTEKLFEGETESDWWSEDFDWSELQTLRAVERLPDLRPANTRFDGMFALVSFDEFLARIDAANGLRSARGLPPLGIAPEVKHPARLEALGFDPVPPLLAALEAHGYRERDQPVWIQSFEAPLLRRLRSKTRLRLLHLLEEEQPEDLAAVAKYADAIGIPKAWVLEEGGAALVERAHAAGLEVHVWTLRAENRFLTGPFRRGDDDATHGDLQGEARALLERCVDALFADHPFPVVRARDRWLEERAAAGARGTPVGRGER